MNTITSSHSKDLVPLQVLAQLLDRLEQGTAPVDAAQYRAVVQSLERALREAPSGDALAALLNAHPAVAELYENLQYQYAGLCRSPLDASLAAEQQAKDTIRHAMQWPEGRGVADSAV